MGTQPRSNEGHSTHDSRITLVRRSQRRAQRITENPTDIGPEPELTPASSGWINDSTPRCVLHPPPPPRVVGGAKGTSAPVSTATLGLIHRHDPSLAAQLRKDPSSLASRSTRLRVYSTMRLIRIGMLGQLASLQQWEEAMHRQDEQ